MHTNANAATNARLRERNGVDRRDVPQPIVDVSAAERVLLPRSPGTTACRNPRLCLHDSGGATTTMTFIASQLCLRAPTRVGRGERRSQQQLPR
jgi:hypothetical protein